ncbi:MAG: twin-arginine translocation signal domain-containing protein, partial [Planctomycetaceae bacterium]
MQISRRTFLKHCALASTALGLGPEDLVGLEAALADPNTPSVLWLQGSGCSGCTISFLNYISSSEPVDATDVLIKSMNLVYHPTLSAGAGESVVTGVKAATNFILLVEGGVPTAFGGHACIPWSDGGREVPFQEAVRTLSEKATRVVCVGTCAAYGGVSAMGANPAAVKSVREAIGKDTINVPGCPPHPNWIVETLVQLLQGKTVPLDNSGRPASIYPSGRMCDQCPFHGRGETRSLGVRGQCMEALGCRGEDASAPCPTTQWNN